MNKDARDSRIFLKLIKGITNMVMNGLSGDELSVSEFF